jgi:hypothetical protein
MEEAFFNSRKGIGGVAALNRRLTLRPLQGVAFQGEDFLSDTNSGNWS